MRGINDKETDTFTPVGIQEDSPSIISRVSYGNDLNDVRVPR